MQSGTGYLKTFKGCSKHLEQPICIAIWHSR